jgi:hypothetical protein
VIEDTKTLAMSAIGEEMRREALIQEEEIQREKKLQVDFQNRIVKEKKKTVRKFLFRNVSSRL